MTTNLLDDVQKTNTVARQIIDRVGDKWTLLVIAALVDGPLRFSHLRKRVEGINPRMLTQTLRGLEQDGIVTRSVYPTAPPRVDYQLTEAGVELLAVVTEICAWTHRHMDTIETARHAYDTRVNNLAKPV